MFCKNCDSILLDNSTFCSICGAKVSDMPTPPQTPSQPPKPYTQPTQPSTPQNAKVEAEAKKKKVNTIYWILLIIGILFVLARGTFNEVPGAFMDGLRDGFSGGSGSTAQVCAVCNTEFRGTAYYGTFESDRWVMREDCARDYWFPLDFRQFRVR